MIKKPHLSSLSFIKHLCLLLSLICCFFVPVQGQGGSETEMKPPTIKPLPSRNIRSTRRSTRRAVKPKMKPPTVNSSSENSTP